MASDRIKRQIERLLDSLEEAVEGRDWQLVRQLAEDVLVLDPDNVDAPPYLAAAERVLGPKQPKGLGDFLPEQDREAADTFSTPVDNPSPPPIDISGEEFIEPSPDLAQGMSETFAQARTRVAREEAGEVEASSISNEQTGTVGPLEAVIRAFTHRFDWKGRAGRSEFWWFYLFFLVGFLCFMPGIFYLVGVLGDNVSYDPMDKYPYLYVVFDLAILLPFAFLIVRRLRDANQSVWWALFAVPGLSLTVGQIVASVYPESPIGMPLFVFYFGCLFLCAMPTHSGTPPDALPKAVGLFILRAVIGIVAAAILFGWLKPIWVDISYMPGDGLTHGVLKSFLKNLILFGVIHFAMVPVLILHNRLTRRSEFWWFPAEG